MNKKLNIQQKIYTVLSGYILLLFAVFGIFNIFYSVNFHGQIILATFQVNKIQTIIHLLTGFSGIVIFYSRKKTFIEFYVKFSAIFYSILAIWGVPAFSTVYDKVLFGYIHVNAPTEIIHLMIGFFGLIVGYVLDPKYQDDDENNLSTKSNQSL